MRISHWSGLKSVASSGPEAGIKAFETRNHLIFLPSLARICVTELLQSTEYHTSRIYPHFHEDPELWSCAYTLTISPKAGRGKSMETHGNHGNTSQKFH
eukprot:2486661-Amphidinium_carterae.1